MTPLILGVIAGATFLLALGLLLWRHAQNNLRQRAIFNFVNQQIHDRMHQYAATEHDDISHQSHAASHPAARIWQDFLLRAGIQANRHFFLRLLLLGLLLIVLAFVFGGTLSVIFTALLYVMLSYFFLWLKAIKRHRKLVHQLPAFLDTMVRLTTIGNSLEASFQSTLHTTDEPLRELFERANRLLQAGMELEHALIQQARIFRLPELELIGAVIGIALRFGGRADTVLERIAGCMRDREQAHNELTALSAEIRLSAWVLGLLPIGLGCFMIIFNNRMFSMMLNDPLGKNMLILAVALEIIGAYWLYRLAKSV